MNAESTAGAGQSRKPFSFASKAKEPECPNCGALRGFSGDHARGCPQFPQPTIEELLDLALVCESHWSCRGLA
jgi:hypothetical protein